MKLPSPDELSFCRGCSRLKNPPCPLGGRDRGENAGRREVPRRILFSQAAAALLPPALGFAAGFILTGFFFPRSGEGPRAAVGVVLMFLFAFGVYLFRRGCPAESSQSPQTQSS
jgi:hypothetical protein